MKRTFQPNNRRRARTHGFRTRMSTRAGRACSGRAPRQGSHSHLGLVAEPFVLPGRRRIRRAEEFRAVMRSGSRAASRTVVVHAQRRILDPLRVPASSSDVPWVAQWSRNRVTRQLRHLMAAHLAGLPAGYRRGRTRTTPVSCGLRRGIWPTTCRRALRRVMTRLGHRRGRRGWCPSDTTSGRRIRSTSGVGHDPRTPAVPDPRRWNPRLPAVHLAALRAHVSLLPHLFGLCSGGGAHPRAGQGVPPCGRAAGALQPLVPGWDRSRAGEGDLAGW